MSSAPPAHNSPRRTSSGPSTAEQSPSSADRSSSRPSSTVSEDSQTVLLNAPAAEPSTSGSPQIQPASRQAPLQLDSDIKKCWICFADETEDTPETSEWRSPCPCALVAHEACLLDWIADMENSNTRQQSIGPPKLLCPQCKNEIHLARPHDYMVDIVRTWERLTDKLVTPAAAVVGTLGISRIFQAHGVHTINMIFGQEDGYRIMAPILDPKNWADLWDAQAVLNHFAQHWRLRIGLPLITPLLFLSRTSLADNILPVLPIMFFATQGDSEQPLDLRHWPPSASMTMALLPYLRGIYNTYYRRVWAARERRWLKEIQPRNGQSETEEERNQQGGDNGDEADEVDANGVLEIDVETDWFGGWFGGGQAAPRPNEVGNRERMEIEREAIRQDIEGDGGGLPVPREGAPEQAPPLHQPPLADDEGEAAPGPDVPRNAQPAQQPQQQQQQQQQQPRAQRADVEVRASVVSSSLTELLLGSILFPSIASIAGEALRLVLPLSWTRPAASTSALSRFRPSSRPKVTGLLQEKWGRSLVGGCLFVVVKDAIMLYVRWKMATQHRSRRVLNHEKKRAVGR